MAYVDPVLPEEVIQFVSCRGNRRHSSRPTARLLSVSSVQTVLPYSATKRTTVLRTARELADPEGRVGTYVRILRVRSTHALRGRLSRRSEISSISNFILGWDHQFLRFGFRRFCRLRRVLRLRHWGLLRAQRDFMR